MLRCSIQSWWTIPVHWLTANITILEFYIGYKGEKYILTSCKNISIADDVNITEYQNALHWQSVWHVTYQNISVALNATATAL